MGTTGRLVPPTGGVEEASVDVTRSVTLVEEKGSELEIARMRHILYGVKPPPDVVRSLAQRQNDDGGFPYDLTSNHLSGVDSTLTALWWMDELGLLESSKADRAIGYLLTVQKEDGGWDEQPVVALDGVPPWIRPGDLGTRLYLTGYAAYWLGVSSRRTHPAFPKAVDFLLEHRDDAGKLHGYLHTTWIAAAVFTMAGDHYAEMAAPSLQFLMDRPLFEWADSQISWALDCLGRAGLPKGHPLVERGLAELLARQDPRGSWSSEDGEAHAVGASIGALKVFKLFGVLSAKP